MQSSQLTITTQMRLAHVIQSIAQNEQLTEKRRVHLSDQQFFQAETSFLRLDQTRVGLLSLSDLVEFLDDNKVAHSQVEAAYLFKRIDWDRDGRISLQDFSKYVLPKRNEPLKTSVQLRQAYSIDVGMLLPNEVESALTELFAQEVNNYRTINIVRQSLVNSLDYSALEAFRTLDLFNQGYITIDTLAVFMRNQSTPLLQDELLAFMAAVDLDQDGRVSYSELVEAVHLMEPLPYRSTEHGLRESEILNAIEKNRSLERVYLPSYPYYFYSYYPYYYPYYYPSLRLENQRQRESSLERLRRSRLSQVESESRIRELENDRIRAQERQRSAERLRQIQEENLLRQSQIVEQNRLRELDRIRDNELRRSREVIRQVEHENRLQQIEAESRARELERESRLIAWERESRIKQVERDRDQAEKEVRLRSLERMNSLDRLRHLEDLRRIEAERLRSSVAIASSPYYSTYQSYMPYYNSVIDKYPHSIIDSVNAFNTVRRYSPVTKSLLQSAIYESPSKVGRKQEFRMK